jgi:hypothetical protein
MIEIYVVYKVKQLKKNIKTTQKRALDRVSSILGRHKFFVKIMLRFAKFSSYTVRV